MSDTQEITPENPRCPVCGAADWFGYPFADYALVAVKKGTTEALIAGKNLLQPVEGFICKSCRFLRLRVTAGALEWPNPERKP